RTEIKRARNRSVILSWNRGVGKSCVLDAAGAGGPATAKDGNLDEPTVLIRLIERLLESNHAIGVAVEDGEGRGGALAKEIGIRQTSHAGIAQEQSHKFTAFDQAIEAQRHLECLRRGIARIP